MTDRHDEREDNIALLIDADNASPEHLDEVLLVLGELGAINVRRAYGNWAKVSLKGWGNLTGLHSIVPMINGGDAAILYCFVFLLIAAAGPGPWSVDASMRRKSIAVTEDETGEPVP